MWKNMAAPQAADDNTIRRMRFLCWMNKAIDTQQNTKQLLLFAINNADANTPQCYVYTYYIYSLL
jgi:hypothetical protein